MSNKNFCKTTLVYLLILCVSLGVMACGPSENPQGNSDKTTQADEVETTEAPLEIVDYAAADFAKFTASGSVTVTYYAVDNVGNEACCTVTVHIVDKEQQLDAEATRYVRFISSKFFKDKDGNFIAEEKGGQNAKSLWATNDVYVTG